VVEVERAVTLVVLTLVELVAQVVAVSHLRLPPELVALTTPVVVLLAVVLLQTVLLREEVAVLVALADLPQQSQLTTGMAAPAA
jgi:hypothetical protein